MSFRSYPGLLGGSDVVRVHMPSFLVYITHLKNYFPGLWEDLRKCIEILYRVFLVHSPMQEDGHWLLHGALPLNSAGLMEQA